MHDMKIVYLIMKKVSLLVHVIVLVQRLWVSNFWSTN